MKNLHAQTDQMDRSQRIQIVASLHLDILPTEYYSWLSNQAPC